MGEHFVGYAVEFLIDAAFLLVALWIMIKIQKLEYTVIGLLGTAALTSLLETILDPLLGVYFSTPIIVIVLTFCVWKLTRADMVDVGYTVGVGFALILGMNLFLLGALMGDLRPSARQKNSFDEEMHEVAANHRPALANEPERPASASDRAPETVVATAPSAARNQSANSVRAVRQPKPSAAKSTDEIARLFTLKSVTMNGNNSMAIISTGVKSYTILLGESIAMQTSGSNSAVVRCQAIEEDSVLLDVDGHSVALPLR